MQDNSGIVYHQRSIPSCLFTFLHTILPSSSLLHSPYPSTPPTPIKLNSPILPIQLEIPRLQILEHSIGIIPFTDLHQPPLILIPISRKDVLGQTGVVLIDISVIEPHLPANILRARDDACGGGYDAFIVGFVGPQYG